MDFDAKWAWILICLHFHSCMTCHQRRPPKNTYANAKKDFFTCTRNDADKKVKISIIRLPMDEKWKLLMSFSDSLGKEEPEMTSWKVMPIAAFTAETFLFGSDLIPLPRA